MFKNASDNAQSRARRAVVETTTNSAGVDEDTYRRGEGRRDELVIRKKELESKAAAILLTIKQATGRARRTGRYSDGTHWNRWQRDLEATKAEIREVERELIPLNTARRNRMIVNERSFERVFIHLAKEMLAGPVYERLVAAAIHRVKEEEAEGGR